MEWPGLLWPFRQLSDSVTQAAPFAPLLPRSGRAVASAPPAVRWGAPLASDGGLRGPVPRPAQRLPLCFLFSLRMVCECQPSFYFILFYFLGHLHCRSASLAVLEHLLAMPSLAVGLGLRALQASSRSAQPRGPVALGLGALSPWDLPESRWNPCPHHWILYHWTAREAPWPS